MKERSFIKRIMAVILCMSFLLSCMNGIFGVTAEARVVTKKTDIIKAEDFIPWDDAMHFVVRHWHTAKQREGSVLQGDEVQKSGDHYFTVVEGYIVPNENSTSNDDKYRVYFMYQSDSAQHKKGDLQRASQIESAYIKEIKRSTGEIVIQANPIGDVEHFSAYSISAGQEAAAIDENENTLTIRYDPYIHLVKAHAFYISNMEAGTGTSDETIFGEQGIYNSLEMDTVEVYAYVSEEDGSYEIYKDSSGKYVTDDSKKDDIPDKEGYVIQKIKLYNTQEGLHTDKTASVYEPSDENDPLDDGRTFNLDLEAWYTEGSPAQVGMVLDASGSMAFSSDDLKSINIKDERVTRKLETSERAPLEIKSQRYKTAKENNGKKIEAYPRKDKMIGYYEFGKKASGNKRGWLLNTVDDPAGTSYNAAYFAKIVDQSELGDSFDFTAQRDLIDRSGWGFSIPNDVPLSFEEKAGSLSGVFLNFAAAGIVTKKPTSDNFTITFSLQQTEKVIGRTEIMYVGALKGDSSYSDYFRVYRKDDDIVCTQGKDEEIVTIKDAMKGLTDPDTHKNVSFVFTPKSEDNGVTTYELRTYLGFELIDIKSVKLSDKNIVFAPFKSDNYNKSNKRFGVAAADRVFSLDNVYIYDTDLNAGELEELNDSVGEKLDAVRTIGFDWENKIFLTDDEVTLLLNPHHTDNSTISAADYSYFVYDHEANTIEYTPIGYWDGGGNWMNDGKYFMAKVYDTRKAEGKVIGRVDNMKTFYPGWYYVTHGGNWLTYYNNDELKTGKRIFSVAGTKNDSDKSKYTLPVDDIVLPAHPVEGYNGEALEGGGSGLVYEQADHSPIRFYIDDKGYLRCFFFRNDKVGYSSYVYELEDNDYIKTEALQRALGTFVTNLSEASPDSTVSAVRFSTSDIVTSAFGLTEAHLQNLCKVLIEGKTQSSVGLGDLDLSYLYRMVQLDWTNDAAISAGIMSQQGRDRENKSPNDLDHDWEKGYKSGAKGFTLGENDYTDGKIEYDKYYDGHSKYNYNIRQYNFGLTGNTSTRNGLLAYMKNLMIHDYDNDDDPDNDTGKKFLIIFTDGKDTELGDFENNTSGFPTNYVPRNMDYKLAYRKAMTSSGTNSYYSKNGTGTKKYTESNYLEAITIANHLKREHNYTIITVMLTGGPVVLGQQDYTRAEVFLTELAGDKTMIGTLGANNVTERKKYEQRSEFFFSTDEAKEDDEKAFEDQFEEDNGRKPTEDEIAELYGNPKASDLLVEIFGEKIIDMITNHKSNYTVKDYIDPRFDLVDKDGTVWHLNDNGKVVKVKTNKTTGDDTTDSTVESSGDDSNKAGTVEEETITLTQKTKYTISLNEDYTDEEAQTPYLRYDANRNMYYLEWVNQTIPSCTVGAQSLSVWNARVNIRAKDDFIGGNAVLSNGNEENMNWVYYPKDQYKSSGVSDYKKSYRGDFLDEYPSKGFPRTTVNITPPKEGITDEKVIYMGEKLPLTDVIQTFKSWTDNPQAQALWDYMERFVNAGKKKDGKTITMADIWNFFEDVSNAKRDLPLDYYYLLNTTDGKNQPGNPEHMDDNLGPLIYTWDVGDRRYPTGDGVVKDTRRRESTLEVEYNAKPVDLRIEDGDNEELVVELEDNKPVYQWNPKYKPVVGEELENVDMLEDTLIRNVVSGEVAMQMTATKEAVNNLIEKGYTGEIKYTADLYREFDNTATNVGKFTATYNVPSSAISSDDVVNAKLTLTPDEFNNDFLKVFGKKTGDNGNNDISLPHTGTTYGLPIGKYYLRTDTANTTQSALFKFGNMSSVDVTPDNISIFTEDTVPNNSLLSLFSTPEQLLDTELPVLKGNSEEDKKAYAEEIARYQAPTNGTNTAYLGTQTKQGYDYTDSRFAIFNVPIISVTGLEISKTVTGTDAEEDLNKEFTFTVTLYSDAAMNNVVTTVNDEFKSGDKTIKFNNGVATFKLKHNESVVISDLPAELFYKVEESDSGDFEVKYGGDGATGRLKANTILKVEVENAKEIVVPPDLPGAGGINRFVYPIIGGLLLFIGYMILRKRKYRTNS